MLSRRDEGVDRIRATLAVMILIDGMIETQNPE